MRIRLSAMTHKGLVRDHNEDCLGWSGWAMSGEVTAPTVVEIDVTVPIVAVVCDGMGGHASGETASRMAATLLTAPGALTEPTADAVGDLLQRTSDAINEAAEKQPFLTGMGSTVVGAVVRPDGSALVFNIGDSRCYRIEGQYLAQLSVDHRSDPHSSAITQALGAGGKAALAPDFFECEVPDEPGLIFCTDGLDDYTDATAIESCVVQGSSDVVANLCSLALSGQAGDNVSVMQIIAIES